MLSRSTGPSLGHICICPCTEMEVHCFSSNNFGQFLNLSRFCVVCTLSIVNEFGRQHKNYKYGNSDPETQLHTKRVNRLI